MIGRTDYSDQGKRKSCPWPSTAGFSLCPLRGSPSIGSTFRDYAPLPFLPFPCPAMLCLCVAWCVAPRHNACPSPWFGGLGTEHPRGRRRDRLGQARGFSPRSWKTRATPPPNAAQSPPSYAPTPTFRFGTGQISRGSGASGGEGGPVGSGPCACSPLHGRFFVQASLTMLSGVLLSSRQVATTFPFFLRALTYGWVSLSRCSFRHRV